MLTQGRHASKQILTEGFNKLLEKNRISAWTWTLCAWYESSCFSGNCLRQKLPLCFWAVFVFHRVTWAFNIPSLGQQLLVSPWRKQSSQRGQQECYKPHTFEWLSPTETQSESEKPSVLRKGKYVIYSVSWSFFTHSERKNVHSIKGLYAKSNNLAMWMRNLIHNAILLVSWASLLCAKGKQQCTCQTAPPSTKRWRLTQSLLKLCSHALLWICQGQNCWEH